MVVVGCRGEGQMNINEQQDTRTDKPAQEVTGQPSFSGESRRRFTKSGLAVSGVLMTLATRPVLGQTLVCKSPSGFLSGNASSHGTPPICQGRSPGYWKEHSYWPISTDTKFSRVFPCSSSSDYATITMRKLLEHQDFDKNNLGMHLVAAYLNALSGWTPFLTTEMILAMFTEWQVDGTFSPTAGVNWTGSEIVDYLKQTQAQAQ